MTRNGRVDGKSSFKNPFYLSVALALALLGTDRSKVIACAGGGFEGVAHTFEPMETLLSEMVGDPFEGGDYIEFRFLTPFYSAKRYTKLYQAAYTSGDGKDKDSDVPQYLDIAAFRSVLKKADLVESHSTAERVVSDYLAYPTQVVKSDPKVLILAFEYLDLEPHFQKLGRSAAIQYYMDGDSAKTPLPDVLKLARDSDPYGGTSVKKILADYPGSPRKPTLEARLLFEDFTEQVANGWGNDVAKNTPESVWDSLLKTHEEWLKRYPNHAMADFVRYHLARLHHLRGTSGAWPILFDLYKKHPARSLWEMRHLLLTDDSPGDVDLTADSLLISALLRPSWKLTNQQWDILWQRSLEHPADHANRTLQERLLLVSAHMPVKEPLPRLFPKVAAVPSVLWGKLRLVSLLAHNQIRDAVAQAKLLEKENDPAIVHYVTRAYYLSGTHAEALSFQKVRTESQAYIVKVGLNDAELDAVRKSKGVYAYDAAMTLALKLASARNWSKGAALIRPFDKKKADRWMELDRLSRDTSSGGKFAYAKALADSKKPVFFAKDSSLSRSLKFRWEELDRIESPPPNGPQNYDGYRPTNPVTPEEKSRLISLLFDFDQNFLALQAYAEYLKVADPKSSNSKKAIAEADRLFNHLLNWDYANTQVYTSRLNKDPAVAEIRKAGMTIRSQKG